MNTQQFEKTENVVRVNKKEDGADQKHFECYMCLKKFPSKTKLQTHKKKELKARVRTQNRFIRTQPILLPVEEDRAGYLLRDHSYSLDPTSQPRPSSPAPLTIRTSLTTTDQTRKEGHTSNSTNTGPTGSGGYSSSQSPSEWLTKPPSPPSRHDTVIDSGDSSTQPCRLSGGSTDLDLDLDEQLKKKRTEIAPLQLDRKEVHKFSNEDDTNMKNCTDNELVYFKDELELGGGVQIGWEDNAVTDMKVNVRNYTAENNQNLFAKDFQSEVAATSAQGCILKK